MSGNHSCVRLSTGGVKCWGRNGQGQLGDGTTTQRLTPVDVSGITSGAVSMAIGYSHSCGMMSGNVLKCWGSNSDSQLGQADIAYSTTPRVVVFASSNYTYGSSSHKHAVTALSTGESYSYDANGNMTTRVEGGLTYTQTFDAENRLISVTVSGQTTQVVYNGDGNLIKKIKPDNSKTLYVGGIYEVDKNSCGTVTGTKTYYPAAGAMRVGSTLYYVLKDHLGSASVVTNASGAIVGENRYYPFGETRITTGTMYTDKLFTGQREIADLGIYHYGARFYSPYINRFLSADTIVPSYANPQSLNRYSYVVNNPLRYTNPTGHMLDDGCSTYDCGSSTPIDYVYIPKKPKKKDGGGSTPTPTPTPCPQVAIACIPVPTSTPSPTSTPTPYTGPSYTNYSTPPSPFPDINVYIDPSRVDLIDAAIDGFGMAVDLLTIIPPTAPIGMAAQPVAAVAEGIGFVKSAVELVRGDPRSMLYDQSMNQGKRVLIMVFRAERLVPAWGAIGNGVSLWLNLKPKISVDWGRP